MIKVSIIIPVYNAEKYLEECIRSVQTQTLNELEIICVDDGSTDNSPEILTQFQEGDKRIVLYRQENQGAGAARNLGIQKAEGKYIAFLDADDYYIDQEALSVMFRICETGNLPVCGSLRKHVKDGRVEAEPLIQGQAADEKICGVLLNYNDFQLDYNYQSFLYLKEHITENKIYFPNYRRFQDPPFLARTLYAAGRFVVAETYLYCYRLSDMEQRFNTQKTCDLLHGLIDNFCFAKEHNLEILFRNTVCRLEDEYVDIICKNITEDSLDVLVLLIQANQMVSDYYKEKSYVIQPIRTLLFCMNQSLYRDRLIHMVKRQEKIAVYGAGKYGKLFLEFLKKNNLHSRVSVFVVSDLKGNETEIKGIPVIELQDFSKEKACQMFVSVRRGVLDEIKRKLDEIKQCSYTVVKEEFLHAIAINLIG